MKTPNHHIITLSPNAILASFALAGLIFVAALGTLGALLFLAAGGVLLLRQPRLVAPEILRYWFLFLVPIFCLLSVFWSDYPGISLRFSLQLGVTFLLAVAIGNRVSARALFVVLFVLYGAAMIASVLGGTIRASGAWIGVFGSKNAFAAVAGTFTLLSTALFFSQGISLRLRIFAAITTACGALLLLKSNSVGTVALTGLACAAAPLFIAFRNATPIRRGAVILFGVLILALTLILVSIYQEDLSAFMLDLTGKDATLTGRTDLWQRAVLLISERPLLGVGYQAFWVQGNSEAEALWAMFMIKARSGFNFHNTYISNAVEIGILGVALQVSLLASAFILSLIRAFRKPDASAIFAAIFMLQLIMQSTIEVVAFFQFNARTVIILALVIYGIQDLVSNRSARPASWKGRSALPAV